ncbi:Vitamin B12-dependent ribonucleoside-diphosphate reductase [uncultured archaeon]|nr:Vitamin B12-dependent ribonucleoside-diphosphate reductase [uncultured archaeon]
MKTQIVKYSPEKSRGHEIGRTGTPYVASAEGVYPENGLKFNPVFSNPAVNNPFEWSPYAGSKLEYELRTASITDDTGKEIFKQHGIEVPKSWSPLATNVVASKYFYGDNAVAGDREQSVPALIDRVARTITDMGVKDGYFASQQDAQTFYRELVSLTVDQFGSFNSPVWFNTGLFHQYGVGKTSGAGNFYYDKETGETKQAATQYEKPQVSACFIQSVDDTMESLMALATSEAMLFKYGSGSGTNLSSIRSTKEKLSGGGTPSGPLSFLKIYDAVAGVVKSGGKTRRAAKMNTLDDWHPDIKEFIEAKTIEEKKAWALIEQGYSGDFNGPAYGSVDFQNENLSVRLSDEFMKAVKEDRKWKTHFVTDSAKEGPTYRARDLLKWIAEGTWTCGDPGVQYHDTINRGNTVSNTGKINCSNPCSEYMFLDDTACNLASLNLHRFVKSDGTFDVARYKSAVEVFITAQEIIIDNASYPTQDIARNSHIYRTLGLGYANLGGLLMSRGLAYGSDEGREVAKAVTALMHNQAYLQSARIASRKGTFEDYEKNKQPMMQVVKRHKEETDKINPELVPAEMREVVSAARQAGLEMILEGERHGFRNAQVTVLAPTGTIGFMMDADTTGIEPDLGLVKYKNLAGGGMLKIANRMVAPGLKRLGYSPEEVQAITKYIEEQDTIEGAPGLKEEHLPVFDCSFKPKKGKRSIHYRDHIKMMAAVQPFLSGAISKTVNLPSDATVEDVMQTYLEAYDLGLKAVALYRDGCKRSQPVSTGKVEEKKEEVDLGKLEKMLAGMGKRIVSVETQVEEVQKLPTQMRERLPQHRLAVTTKYDMGTEHEFYITTGFYDDGRIGETFLTASKEGSFANGMADIASTFISMVLQNGTPVQKVAEHLVGTNFEPSGWVAPRSEGGLLASLIKNPVQGRVNSVGELLGKHLLVAQDLGYELSGRIQGTNTAQEKPTPAVVATQAPLIADSSGKDEKTLREEQEYAEFMKGKEPGKICPLCQRRMAKIDNHCTEACICGNISKEGCSG